MKKVDKFSKDAFANLLAVGLGGVLYVLLNALIINSYSEATLGVFNQAFAIYILFSQLTVFGIHLSIQQFVPRYKNDVEILKTGLFSALLCTGIISTLVTVLAYPTLPWITGIFNSIDVTKAVQLCLWGVVFFSLNKVLLAYLNGMRLMVSFALGTLIRFVGMFLCVVVIIFVIDKPQLLVLALVIPELFLFLLLLILSRKNLMFKINKQVFKYVNEHISFGKNAFIGNVLIDVNTRVDVVMLGYFLTDSEVGIYSFVLAVAEGILQIPVVFRNNINPIITKASVLSNLSGKLSRVLSKNIRAFYKVIGGIALLAIVCYPVGLFVLSVEEHFWVYWALFAILVGGIVLASGYLPFNMMFNQLNKPGIQSRFFFWIFIINVLANGLLIKTIGLYGAAIGTSISYISHVFLIKHFAKKHCDLQLSL